jgi:transcriptional regulator with XRE-family HTH domain
MSNALRDWREARHLKLKDMAEALGIATVSTYQKYEIGRHAMPAPVVARLERLTGGAVDARAMNAIRIGWLEDPARSRDGAVTPIAAE